ncbi:unnamed protein product [Strongylus vulgaris]|uniref:Uncharacterized protein n=1 Tax=Strongylus vulgaris TaxID=40348 RepID=A0A3P7LL50_STRVU|nr:unnamed protein product [Strongylus vulgaris]
MDGRGTVGVAERWNVVVTFPDLDDDDDYYGRSFEEEVAMSPSVNEYMYQRQRMVPEFKLGSKLSDFIPEERRAPDEYGDDDMFDMEEDNAKSSKPAPPTAPSTSTALDTGPPPGLGFDQPRRNSKPIVISLGPIAGHGEEKPVIPNITNLRISEAERSEGNKSPTRKKASMTSAATLPANSSSHR